MDTSTGWLFPTLCFVSSAIVALAAADIFISHQRRTMLVGGLVIAGRAAPPPRRA